MLQGADRLVDGARDRRGGLALHVVNVVAAPAHAVAAASRRTRCSRRCCPARRAAGAGAIARGRELRGGARLPRGRAADRREIRESLCSGCVVEGDGAMRPPRSRSRRPARAGRASEDLLALFEQLTERYERSMQVLMASAPRGCADHLPHWGARREFFAPEASA
jgi:hypothetical protein